MTRELYKKVDFKKNFKLYIKMAKPYKWLFLVVVILATLMESFSLAEKYLFKIVLDSGSEFIAKTLTQAAFLHTLILVGAVFIGLSLFRIANHWYRILLLNKVEVGMIFDIKNKFFNHIMRLDHSFHTTHKTGSMISKLNRGTNALERMTDFLVFNVAPLFLQLILISGSLLILDWAAAAVILLTATAFIAYGLYISQIQKPAHIESYTAEDTEKGAIADIFTNIDSIKYFGKENYIGKRYRKISENTKYKMLRFWNYGRYFSAGQNLILAVGTFFAVYFPLMKFIDGGITIGTLAFIYSVYGGLMGLLFGFVNGIRGFYISLGDFDALFQYEEIKNEIQDKPDAEKLKIKDGEIEFRDIDFGYHTGRNNRAVRKLNLKINKNEKVALVGHSGCGKTTLVKLLYRLYDVDRGEILIDNKNINEFKQEALRSELSIVPQECILFDDTIYNNILFSRPNATRKEVMGAIKSSQLDKFVANLPQKENTIVGERGVKLSGGEKQRVSIARAILADKKILILDEATSSLDSQTEWEIQRALKKLMQNRTSVIIAHRLSTIMHSDKIVVIDKGRIVQLGRHRDLINQPGIYRQLWNLQKGGYLRE
ncbi:MAG: ABC transporter ATP-binding protein/permease [Nanoarchaeota archaeon]|nr:ABC transporter ATP-binding protein/permease [Nanoarchaeota archaeon]MBU0978175.1 ABC transporter ATP-binding protein/permease [Nanoarchaeota archaeon]